MAEPSKNIEPLGFCQPPLLSVSSGHTRQRLKAGRSPRRLGRQKLLPNFREQIVRCFPFWLPRTAAGTSGARSSRSHNLRLLARSVNPYHARIRRVGNAREEEEPRRIEPNRSQPMRSALDPEAAVRGQQREVRASTIYGGPLEDCQPRRRMSAAFMPIPADFPVRAPPSRLTSAGRPRRRGCSFVNPAPHRRKPRMQQAPAGYSAVVPSRALARLSTLVSRRHSAGAVTDRFRGERERKGGRESHS